VQYIVNPTPVWRGHHQKASGMVAVVKSRTHTQFIVLYHTYIKGCKTEKYANLNSKLRNKRCTRD